jgi:Carboxypeptidase regulatory-like domain/TonB dependent receptor
MSSPKLMGRVELGSQGDFALRMSVLRVLCVVSGCIILAVSPAFGQAMAELAGTATDLTGAVLVGLQVTATNEESGVAKSTLTNEAGAYRLLNLQPGRYRIEASLTGFKTYTSTVELEVGRVTSLNISMQIGEITEKIQVEGQAATLETQSQAVSNLIEGAFLKDMPLLLRRPAQLLNISAGVTFTSTDSRSYFNPFYSVAGGRQSTQQYYIDGGNASNTRVEISILDINPSIETVQEFRLVQNNYKAEFGGGGGGLMLINTKSGTNEIHGSVWEFHRQKALDARNFFAPEKTPYREHIFGGAVGGPIIKNKLHYFGSWEATHNVFSYPQFSTLPTPEQLRGDFSKRFNRDGSLRVIYDPLSTRVAPDGTITRTPFPNNIIPADRINPIAAKIASYFPGPNRPGLDPSQTNNHFGTRNEYLDRNAYTARIDWDKSDRDKVFHRFLLDFPQFENDGPWPGHPGFDTSKIVGAKKNLADRHPADASDFITPTWSKNFLTGWTHVFNPQLVNELRVTYSTRLWGSHNPSSGLGFPQQLGLKVPPVSPSTSYKDAPNDHFPNTMIEGFTSPGTNWGGGAYQVPMRNFHAADTVSMLRHNHSFKFGYETRRSSSTYYYKNASSGTYTFQNRSTAANPTNAASGDGLASLLLDFPIAGALNDIDNRVFHTWLLGGFVQDDWKVTPNLTLILGLRYDVDTPMTEKEDRIAGFDTAPLNPVSNTPGTVTFPDRFNVYDLTNLMPRVGFAWSPKGGKTVVRGGFGMFYNPPYGASIWGIPGTARPDVARTLSVSSPDNGVTAPYSLTNGLPAPPPFSPSQLNPGFGAVPVGQNPFLAPDFIDYNRSIAYNMMFNFDIQREFKDILFEIGWLGNMGHHLDRGTLRLNQVPPQLMGPGNTQILRPFPQFNQVNMFTATIGNSSYHSLVVKAEKRFGNGLGFVSSYTWSKFIDDFAVSDFYNRGIDKGPSSLQRAHLGRFSGVYNLPWGVGRQRLSSGPLAHILGGWNLGGIFTAESGQPLTMNAIPNQCNCFSDTNVRPNLIGNPNGPKQINNWFNVAAFEHPGNFKFGNAGPGLVEGPGLWNIDFSIGKDAHITERKFLNFRVDLFNALNHTNLLNPIVSIFPASSPGTTNVITSSRDARRIQLGIKFTF